MADILKPGRILVVDDDPVALDLLSARLAAAGYETLRASGGLQALHMVQEQKPQVVVADWIMPGMDGLTLCRQVRSVADNDFVYFIMLTVQTDKDRMMEAFEGGVDDFLSKPFHEGELLARIRAGIRLVSLCEELDERTGAAQRLTVEMSRLNTRLQQLAGTDELTGLANRRQAMSRMRELWALSQRGNQPLSCAIIDVDSFKQLNDTRGHLKGDEVLQKIAAVLSKSVRAGDMVSRIGGDEFLILFPMQSAEQASAIAARCRSAVASEVFAGPGHTEPVTISAGTSERSECMASPDDLLRAADQLLYQAKAQRRNAETLAASA